MTEQTYNLPSPEMTSQSLQSPILQWICRWSYLQLAVDLPYHLYLLELCFSESLYGDDIGKHNNRTGQHHWNSKTLMQTVNFLLPFLMSTSQLWKADYPKNSIQITYPLTIAPDKQHRSKLNTLYAIGNNTRLKIAAA